MDKNRLWMIGAILVMVIIVGGGWALAIQPQLDAAASADLQRGSVEATNVKNQAQLAKLKSDYTNLTTLKAQTAELDKSVPTSPAMPALVDELNALAAAHGVTLVGFTVSDAQAYTPVVPPPAAEQPAATSTASPTPSPTPASPLASTPKPAGVPPFTSPLITPSNFAAIPVAVGVQGAYSNVLDFVKGVQSGDRLFLVTSLSTSPSAEATGVDGKLSGFVYVLIQPTKTAAAN